MSHLTLKKFHNLLLTLAIACLLGISEAGPPIAKPGCKDHCGNVSIPYPFGIGPGCYHNPYFDVECIEGSDSFILKGLNDYVYGSQIITTNGLRWLVSPVPCFRYCGGDGSPQTTVFGYSSNLTGTPFMFSNRGNVLLVNSCGSAVILRDKKGEPIGGCGAVCAENGTSPGVDCFGVGCCQSTISSSIDSYTLEVDSIGGNSGIGDGCTRAVLVDSKFIAKKKKDLRHFEGLCDPSQVILEWSVMDLPVEDASYANAKCVNKSPSINDAGGYVCLCRAPFHGNPYLPFGCQRVTSGVYE